jgi:L-lysine 2,3-aminomutase
LFDDDADELIRLFERIVRSGKNLAIMAHFNHPVELSVPRSANSHKTHKGNRRTNKNTIAPA